MVDQSSRVRSAANVQFFPGYQANPRPMDRGNRSRASSRRRSHGGTRLDSMTPRDAVRQPEGGMVDQAELQGRIGEQQPQGQVRSVEVTLAAYRHEVGIPRGPHFGCGIRLVPPAAPEGHARSEGGPGEEPHPGCQRKGVDLAALVGVDPEEITRGDALLDGNPNGLELQMPPERVEASPIELERDGLAPNVDGHREAGKLGRRQGVVRPSRREGRERRLSTGNLPSSARDRWCCGPTRAPASGAAPGRRGSRTLRSRRRIPRRRRSPSRRRGHRSRQRVRTGS